VCSRSGAARRPAETDSRPLVGHAAAIELAAQDVDVLLGVGMCNAVRRTPARAATSKRRRRQDPPAGSSMTSRNCSASPQGNSPALTCTVFIVFPIFALTTPVSARPLDSTWPEWKHRALHRRVAAIREDDLRGDEVGGGRGRNSTKVGDLYRLPSGRAGSWRAMGSPTLDRPTPSRPWAS